MSVVGADEAGKALVAACEDAGVKVCETVEMGGANCEEMVGSPSGGDDARDEVEDSLLRTASYMAVLGGDGELVAAVADMRVLDNMTPVSEQTRGEAAVWVSGGEPCCYCRRDVLDRGYDRNKTCSCGCNGYGLIKGR